MTTAAALAAGALSAGSQYAAGRQQAKSVQRQGEFNAQIYEQQGNMIKEQKKLQDYQYHRAAAQRRGAIVAHTAGSGLNLSGSPLAIMVDSESQMLFDKAAMDYNLDVQANMATSQASAQRGNAYEQARLARFTGTTNALSTALNTGVTFGSLRMPMRAA